MNDPIQIDDQDDNDNISYFCTIFVAVGKRNLLEIEIAGAMPITQGLADLAEIYGGHADAEKGKITLSVNPHQIDALLDLGAQIRKTAYMGKTVGNPHWERVSARTISSLHRFVRTIKEYQLEKNRL